MSFSTENGLPWRPSATWENLRLRAELLAQIRQFFRQRNVVEVETPSIGSATAGYPDICCFLTSNLGHCQDNRQLYLQSSPEAAMKRLIAAGSGAIYQICKAFRSSDLSAHHNPEFTILEYYRPYCDLSQLLDEVDSLLSEVLGLPAAEHCSYGSLFQRYIGLDPHTASHLQLRDAMERQEIAESRAAELPDAVLLDMLFSRLIQPHLGVDGRPVFVTGFPASQACLARLSGGEKVVAERCEVYVFQVELGNACQELTDAQEQRARFQQDNELRKNLSLPPTQDDKLLLAALASGMPVCSGIALGVDRMVMIQSGAKNINEVIAFPWQRI